MREELVEQPPGDLLARAVRVHVGGVEVRHAGLDRTPHERFRGVLAENPVSLGLAVSVAHHDRVRWWNAELQAEA